MNKKTIKIPGKTAEETTKHFSEYIIANSEKFSKDAVRKAKEYLIEEKS